jgi:hypothetical protein
MDRPVGWGYFQGEPLRAPALEPRRPVLLQRRAPRGLGNESAPAHGFVVVPPSAELGEAAKGTLRPRLSFRFVAALALLIVLPAVAPRSSPRKRRTRSPSGT